MRSMAKAQDNNIPSHRTNFKNNLARLVAAYTNGNVARFARLAGINRVTIMKWLSGTSLPDGESLIQIKQQMGIGIDELLTGNTALPVSTFKAEDEKDPLFKQLYRIYVMMNRVDKTQYAMENEHMVWLLKKIEGYARELCSGDLSDL